MPGLSFVCDFQNDLRQKTEEIDACFRSLLHNPDYRYEALLEEPSFVLGCTGYEGYPTSVFQTDDLYIFLEGRVYGRNQREVEEELLGVAARLFAEEPDESNIVEWQLRTDGEFILFILNRKTDEICILNDALGHLPLYYSESRNQVVVSRDIRFITKLLDDLEFDKISLAQYLLLRYPLEERTLWKNIKRLKPLSLVRIHPGSRKLELKTLYTFNFANKRYEGRSAKENVQRLVPVYEAACRNRVMNRNGLKNVMSLSGGLDSRIVACSLKRCDIPFLGATFLDSRKRAAADVAVARQLAECLGVEWRVFELSPPTGKDALSLLRLKSGMNYLAMSFITPFLSQLRTTYGSRINYFTGDTGLALRGKSITFRPKNLENLLDYIIGKNSRIPLSAVARIIGVDKRELVDEFLGYLDSLPENELDDKYAHFTIIGRGTSWHYEGMDRNRCFFWSAAPMEATPFFIEAMDVPDEQKRHHGLCESLVKEIYPEACRVANANTGRDVGSWRAGMKEKVKNTMVDVVFGQPALKRTLKRLLGQRDCYARSAPILECMRSQMDRCPSIGRYLSVEALEDLQRMPERYSKLVVDTLFTITSVIEDFTCGESSLEEYADATLVG